MAGAGLILAGLPLGVFALVLARRGDDGCWAWLAASNALVLAGDLAAGLWVWSVVPAACLAVALWFWRRRRRGRRRGLRARGAKALARLAAMTRALRERRVARPVLRPVPGAVR